MPKRDRPKRVAFIVRYAGHGDANFFVVPCDDFLAVAHLIHQPTQNDLGLCEGVGCLPARRDDLTEIIGDLPPLLRAAPDEG